ncbi:unnamed protein product [Nyctereutes procyonoides]|uniref:(raccoon dog) hypothetical protein n=1 Tax=Nyctereutes procyonoides TaxID=34880 RepID=A0A811ZP89_NYCPR|nr:unnamed protein product [Nyctereutes procyonoides]
MRTEPRLERMQPMCPGGRQMLRCAQFWQKGRFATPFDSDDDDDGEDGDDDDGHDGTKDGCDDSHDDGHNGNDDKWMRNDLEIGALECPVEQSCSTKIDYLPWNF